MNASNDRRLLPWLLAPGPAEVAQTQRLAESEVSLQAVRHLSQYEWNAAGLRRLASAVPRLPANEQASLLPVRLLMFSNASSKHLATAISGSGIRHGLMISTLIVEYEEPEDFIAREHAAIEAFAPQIVVLNIDSSKFSLVPTLGDEAACAATAQQVRGRLAAMRKTIRERLGVPVIQQTLSPNPSESRLNVDRMIAGSYKDLIARSNAAIAALAGESGDLLLDVAALAETVGLNNWFSPRYWAVGKYPFAPDMAPLYADHLVQLAALQFGRSRRVLVLDLDNTLWGGIVGDDGKDGLMLGPGSAVGESHAAVQHYAKALAARGIILCLSSKNEESVAMDAFRTHPEMVLREGDIASFQINWQDKAANIQALSRQLGLGLESFVFLDDNPVERARVRQALPDVAVPEVPKDVAEWPAVLQMACYFETRGFSEEDAKRTEYYRANAQRVAQLESFGDQDAFLRSLSMEMDIRPFDKAGRMRIAQLIAKSNQFNLTTRRYSEDEVAAAQDDPTIRTYQVRLRDAYGDNGMVSVVIMRDDGASYAIDTWLMSCRVLGRRLEEAILDRLVEDALADGKSSIMGTYIPTKKNMMVKNHYATLGFSAVETRPDGTSTWRLDVAGYAPKSPPISTATTASGASVPQIEAVLS